MPPPDRVAFTFQFSTELHNRAKIIAKRLGVTLVQLIRDSLREKLEYLEERFRIEEARALAEKERLKNAKHMKKLPKPGELPPLQSTLEPTKKQEKVDPLKRHYEEQGRKIAVALDRSPMERRLAIAEAISAIKKAAPLTHPPDEEIKYCLEQVVILERAKIDAALAAKKAAGGDEPLVEREVDHTRVKSYGDID